MVYVHLAEGFEEVEATTIVDLLRRAEIEVKTVSIMDDKLVTGAHGMSLQADLLFEEADYDTCEMIVLPGGMPGALHLKNHDDLGEIIMGVRNDRQESGSHLCGSDGAGCPRSAESQDSYNLSGHAG